MIRKFLRKSWIFFALLLLSSCEKKKDFDFYDLDGNGYIYSELREFYLVVNYWAVWCAPCKIEIPELQALHDDNPNVMVFGVNYDGSEKELAKKQTKEMKISFPVYNTDPAESLGIKRPEVLPTTLVFNSEKNLLATLVGPQTKESLLEVIENH